MLVGFILFFACAAEAPSICGGNMMMSLATQRKSGFLCDRAFIFVTAQLHDCALVLVFREWMGQNYGVGYWLLAVVCLLLALLYYGGQPVHVFKLVRKLSGTGSQTRKRRFLAFLTVILCVWGFEIPRSRAWISTYWYCDGRRPKPSGGTGSLRFYVSLSLGAFSVCAAIYAGFTVTHGLYGWSFLALLAPVLMLLSLIFLFYWLPFGLGLGCSAIFPMLFAYASSIMSLNGEKRTGWFFVSLRIRLRGRAFHWRVPLWFALVCQPFP